MRNRGELATSKPTIHFPYPSYASYNIEVARLYSWFMYLHSATSGTHKGSTKTIYDIPSEIPKLVV